MGCHRMRPRWSPAKERRPRVLDGSTSRQHWDHFTATSLSHNFNDVAMHAMISSLYRCYVQLVMQGHTSNSFFFAGAVPKYSGCDLRSRGLGTYCAAPRVRTARCHCYVQLVM